MVVSEIRNSEALFHRFYMVDGTEGLEGYNPHGRARIQRSSTIFAAIIDHVCEKVMRDLLLGKNARLRSPEDSPVEE